MTTATISPALKQRMDAVPLGWPSPNLLKQKGMFEKKLITDLHGPLLDYVTPVVALAKGLYKGAELDPSLTKYYQMAYDAEFALSPTQWHRVFETFARLGRGGYGDLPIREDYLTQFKMIRDAGIPINVWTWVPGATEHTFDTKEAYGTGIAQSATYELIEKMSLLDNVERQVRFINPSNKAPEMAEEHYALMIEDKPSTAVAIGADYGNCCILTPETYNAHVVSPGVLRINDASELAATVIDFFKKLEDAGCLVTSEV